MNIWVKNVNPLSTCAGGRLPLCHLGTYIWIFEYIDGATLVRSQNWHMYTYGYSSIQIFTYVDTQVYKCLDVWILRFTLVIVSTQGERVLTLVHLCWPIYFFNLIKHMQTFEYLNNRSFKYLIKNLTACLNLI